MSRRESKDRISRRESTAGSLMEQQIQNRISKKNKKNQAYNLIQLSDI